MIQLPGYSVTEQIYAGTKTLVYRGIRDDQKPVVIKLMRSEYPSFNELVQFRNQYTIAKNLDLPGIVKPYTLEPYRNGYALVMEDFGGISLKDYATNVETLHATSLHEFLDIAIQIVSTLDGLHHQRIIHKDIKPSNIVINPETLEVKLIDFSIASLLPRETQHSQNPNVLEGTLAYISPEQTGRMNRSLDYRTDFYSLGVTFSELLTGQLPFTSEDPMELVHCHIALQPPSVHSLNPEIPLIVSEIVAKLMAKNADLRYQTARGLKYDLEKCFLSLKQTGSIDLFELGSRDTCDRFLIREKLYGREAEVQTLLAAFDRVAAEKIEMLLVAGFSGIGKTAVVNEVHKPIVAARGYFIKGKFDQFGRNIPFSGFVQAFRELMGLLLGESDASVQQWTSKILLALGENAQVIIELIPELELIIGKQPAVAELSGTAATNRFNLLFQRFISVFTTIEHPLVIFLDDLQWADSASLKLIQLLMSETDGSHLLLIGAYRDNEVSPGHPLMQTLEEIRKAQATINTITLAPLKQSDLNNLIADTLCCTKEIAQPLTELVYQKTQGNPFFSNQFLKSLHLEGLIYFNGTQSPQSLQGDREGGWQCDIASIRALALTDDVVEFMALQLQKLPEPTQLVLKLAACIGNSFDLNTLSIVHEKSLAETAADLWFALQSGLILPTSEVYKFYQDANGEWEMGHGAWDMGVINNAQCPMPNAQCPNYRFLHDRVQQAAYSLICEDQKKLTHLKIGQLLLNNTPEAQQEEKILDIVNQLNIGVDLITNQLEKDELADLNLIAGRKAKASTAYTAAMEYFQVGLGLLGANSWVIQYNRTLTLYVEAAEAAYLSGNFEQMEELAEVVRPHAKTVLDQVKVYEVKIQAFIAQNKLLEAVDTALDILNRLGITFPKKPNKLHVFIGLIGTKSALVGKRIADLVNLPEMTDLYQISAMRIFLAVSPAIYFGSPNLYALTIFKKVRLSIKYGNTRESALAYLDYGTFLCGILGDIETGYQFGEIAIHFFEQYQVKQLKARIFMIFNALIKHWKNHLSTTLQPLLEGCYSGLETGELDYAVYAAHMYSINLYFAGKNLEKTRSEISKYSKLFENYKQKTVLNFQKIFEQIVLNLIAKSNDSCCLVGSAYDEGVMLPIHEQANDRTAIFVVYSQKMFLNYLFGNYYEARDNMVCAQAYLDSVIATVYVPIFFFYSSLVNLAIYSNALFAEKRNILVMVKANQKKMKKWANYAPMNHLHKWHLVEAEVARVRGNNSEAMEHYDRAITLAGTNEYTQEQAIANELAAKFYLEWGKQNIAQLYLTQAYYCYARWGAKAKVNDLEKRYPELLTPILQQTKISLDAHSTITTSGKVSIGDSTTSISDALDLAAVVKASSILSGEIQLEQLLSTLMQVVMQIAGASKCALILHQDNNLRVGVTASADASDTPAVTIASTPLESSPDVPITLINYVYRTKEMVIDDVLSPQGVSLPVESDRYILLAQPKSLLCIPVINQGKLLGILYLENNLTEKAFTSDRVEILKLITTQAAISLENAMLYKNLAQANQSLEDANHFLEHKVALRTQELNDKNQSLAQTLKELKLTQAQLIQAEKMSSLGQMVAGVAHEINNPINFIQANITYTSEYVQSLLDLIAVYQQEYPNESIVIKEKSEEIELDFLVKDLPSILESMNVGSERIKNIVLSLRNFSRLDEAELKPVDIHQGIESTLMILQHRLKAQDNSHEIQVIKEYGQLPQVTCYASQMNQVFMNIFSNAIDALQEGMGNREWGMGNGEWGMGNRKNAQCPMPAICIHTELASDNTVKICITDNGIGMSAEITERIFDPFFTTKPVGSGTGLGLSISYQIVVELHGGQLTCISTAGQGTTFTIQIPIAPSC